MPTLPTPRHGSSSWGNGKQVDVYNHVEPYSPLSNEGLKQYKYYCGLVKQQVAVPVTNSFVHVNHSKPKPQGA